MRWFLKEAQKGNIVLALSCHPDDESDLVTPRVSTSVERFAFTPLDPSELRALLNLRFIRNDFPNDLVEILYSRTGGQAPQVSRYVFNLVRRGGFVEGQTGWHLPGEGVASASIVKVFEFSIYDPIEELIEELGLDGPDLEYFLQLGSLCGQNVPANLLKNDTF